MNFDPRLIFIPALRVGAQPPPRKLTLRDAMSSRALLELESLSREDVNEVCAKSITLLLETLAPHCPAAKEILDRETPPPEQSEGSPLP